ncbi:hypothetical protein DBW61_01515 [bacterium]|nr:MAG: hypothetical protein DBW61_01515 [bacterium]
MIMNNYRLYFLIIVSTLSASINFNYESKYGNGNNVDDFTQDTTLYYYFENLLDINFNHNNIYLYTQLEYSNPPIYGIERRKVDKLTDSYFVEYSNSYIGIKWGYLQSLYGYGLDINTFQDQSTDFDNRVKGVELKYTPNDILDLFYISGTGKYGSKSSGSLRTNDLSFDHNLQSYGAQLYTDLGDFSISSSTKKTYYSGGIYNKLINTDTRLSIDLQDYIFTDFSLFDLDSEVKSSGINLSYSNTLGNYDIYIENMYSNYNKILRNDENEDGYLRYISLSGDLYGINILYEFKDYNMLYYMPISSNPPLVFGETTSVLISRIQHNINFADEIGHQLELRGDYKDNSLLLNMSIGMKHSGIRNQNDFSFDDEGNLIYGTYKSVSFNDIISDMNFLNEDLRAHKPFRDIYFETSGWRMNNSLYYKFGYLSHYSYDNSSGKNYQSFTVPTQFVIGLKNNNSITIYYEYQETNNLVATIDDYNEDTYTYNYMSLSYHIKDFGSLSYFSDKENIEYYIDGSSKTRYWTGVELSLELSSTMQISIFKGSQKGGLVCANGVCAVQPSFEDGIKVTFRALF